MRLIEIQNLIFSYPRENVSALSGINLGIDEGEFVLICGSSGCGKTTLIKQLIPSIAPHGTLEGEICLQSKSIEEYDDATLAREIGYVGQNPSSQMITDKVWHELAFGMENLGLDNETMQRRIAEICEFFGMQSWINRNVDSLSGGEMQMVHLAAVMVMEPRVLILDEPIAQLDPLAARNFLDMLNRINTELGTTIIVVEHHLEDVYGMATKVVAMKRACIDYVGNPREVATKLNYKSGLPTSLIIAKSIETVDTAGSRGDKSDSNDVENSLPLTVAEGQRWMARRFAGIDKKKLDNNEDSQVNIQDNDGQSQTNLQDENGKESRRDIVLRMKEIGFGYDEYKAVLNDCNLDVHEGEVFAVMGGNGTGKSTLLSILCQTLKQAYGTVEIFGKKIKSVKDAPLGFKGMVYLPQDPMALFTEITVSEELEEALHDLDISVSDKKDSITRMLYEVGLKGYERLHPYDLSAGQKQVLAFAKLLLLEPRIILMDEPTKGLDFDRKKELGSMLRKLTEEGVTILMVSHDIEFCARYASRCALLHDGRVVSALPRQEFFAGNKFFTTASNRIARRYAPKAILPEEVIAFCKEEM